MVLSGLRLEWKQAQTGWRTKHTQSGCWRGKTITAAECSLAWWCTISISSLERSSCSQSPFRRPRPYWRRCWRTASFLWNEKPVWLWSTAPLLYKPFAFGSCSPRECSHYPLTWSSSRNTWWAYSRRGTSWPRSPISFASHGPLGSSHALHCSPSGSGWSPSWRIYSLNQLGEWSHLRRTLVQLSHSLSGDPSYCHLGRLFYSFFLQAF